MKSELRKKGYGYVSVNGVTSPMTSVRHIIPASCASSSAEHSVPIVCEWLCEVASGSTPPLCSWSCTQCSCSSSDSCAAALASWRPTCATKPVGDGPPSRRRWPPPMSISCAAQCSAHVCGHGTFRAIAYSMRTAERIARSDDGSSFAALCGIFGTNSITSIAVSMMMIMNASSTPSFHTPWPISNGWSCDIPITTASPQQKPSITDAAISVMYRWPPIAHTTKQIAPAVITDGKSSSTPSPLPPFSSGRSTSVEMIAANAPSAPFTIPDRPPRTVQIRPTTHAACSATGGLMCAMNANATDSGICAKQIVMPSSTSVLIKSARVLKSHVWNSSWIMWLTRREPIVFLRGAASFASASAMAQI